MAHCRRSHDEQSDNGHTIGHELVYVIIKKRRNPINSAREKNNWYNSIREEAEKKMVAFSWSSVGSRRSRG